MIKKVHLYLAKLALDKYGYGKKFTSVLRLIRKDGGNSEEIKQLFINTGIINRSANCKYCGQSFIANGWQNVFCSTSCKGSFYSAEWRQRNPNKRRQYQQEYRDANRDKIRERQREWWKAKHNKPKQIVTLEELDL